MEQKMGWIEIKKTFQDEWVALADYKLTGAIEVEGVIIAHHHDKDIFYKDLGQIRDQYPNIAVRFTGPMIKDPEIPLLWQITHTE